MIINYLQLFNFFLILKVQLKSILLFLTILYFMLVFYSYSDNTDSVKSLFGFCILKIYEFLFYFDWNTI